MKYESLKGLFCSQMQVIRRTAMFFLNTKKCKCERPIYNNTVNIWVRVTCFHVRFVIKAWPNPCNISTQHVATLLHDVATMSWTGWPNTQFNKWTKHACPSATMLHERGQTRTTSCNNQNVAQKSWPFSNLIQHHLTCSNISQHIERRYATCCAQQCCKMLHWNVASVWPDLNRL